MCIRDSAATLPSIQSNIFSTCAGGQCHGSAAKGGLNLSTAAKSCANLINIAAEDSLATPTCNAGGALAATMKRVVPGDPAASFLLSLIHI